LNPIASFSQTYPSGFSQVQVATGLTNPTIMTASPDGRIFIAQQNGVLRVFKNGSLLATPFVSLSVNSSGERGLLGIAFDPNFASNQFIYLYYTVSSGANNRISRFTANGDVAVAGAPTVLGQRSDNAFAAFDGYIDEAATYNYALTLAQAQNHFFNSARITATKSGNNIILT
jgi:glucose/arabinose dehydrogenase